MPPLVWRSGWEIDSFVGLLILLAWRHIPDTLGILGTPPLVSLTCRSGSVEVHRYRGIVHLSGGIGQVPLPLWGMTLSPLVIILVIPIVKGARSVSVLKWVLQYMVPPSDNVINCLTGSDCFYGSLL